VHMFYERDGLVRDTEHLRVTDPEPGALSVFYGKTLFV